MNVTIIKIGGSIITHKHSGRPTLATGAVRRLARELVDLHRSNRLGPCILLHGAGSFGHPLVFRHKLNGRRLSRETISPVTQTIQRVNRLTSLLVEELLRAGLPRGSSLRGLPVVPLQTTSMVTGRDSQWKFLGKKILARLLRSGTIPVMSGQLVISDDGQSTVMSADRLMMILAKIFKTTRLIFCTDVDGVYKIFPPRVGESHIKKLDRPALMRLIHAPNNPRHIRTNVSEVDVTGAMTGKLREILNIKNATVAIVNGWKAGRLRSAFGSKPQGTMIRLK